MEKQTKKRNKNRGKGKKKKLNKKRQKQLNESNQQRQKQAKHKKKKAQWDGPIMSDNIIMVKDETVNVDLPDEDYKLMSLLEDTNQSVIDILQTEKKKKLKIQTFDDSGSVYLICGGYPRDLILRNVSRDIDIIIHKSHLSLFKDEFIRHCLKNKLKFNQKNEIVFRHGPKEGMRLVMCEVTINKEVYDLDFVDSTDKEMDLRRNAGERDFSINSSFFHLKNQKPVFYFVKGTKDHFYDAVITTHNTFSSMFYDPSRIMRYIRLKSRLDLKIDEDFDNYVYKNGWAALQEWKTKDKDDYNISLKVELTKMVKDDTWHFILQDMLDYDFFPFYKNSNDVNVSNALTEFARKYEDKTPNEEYINWTDTRIFVFLLLLAESLNERDIFKCIERMGVFFFRGKRLRKKLLDFSKNHHKKKKYQKFMDYYVDDNRYTAEYDNEY